jgi:hypothetical protein
VQQTKLDAISDSLELGVDRCDLIQDETIRVQNPIFAARAWASHIAAISFFPARNPRIKVSSSGVLFRYCTLLGNASQLIFACLAKKNQTACQVNRILA